MPRSRGARADRVPCGLHSFERLPRLPSWCTGLAGSGTNIFERIDASRQQRRRGSGGRRRSFLAARPILPGVGFRVRQRKTVGSGTPQAAGRAGRPAALTPASALASVLGQDVKLPVAAQELARPLLWGRERDSVSGVTWTKLLRRVAP